MGRAFDFLPYVDNCCNCCDLKSACVFIMFYVGLLSCFSMTRFVFIGCVNMRENEGFGLFIYILDHIVSAGGLIQLICIIIFGVTFSMNKPIVKPFVLAIIIQSILEAIASIIYMIRMKSLDYKCKIQTFDDNTRIQKIHPFWSIFQIFTHLIGVGLLLYYAIVVNSYAKLWDQHGGNIPVPEPVYYQIVRVPPPDSGAAAQAPGGPGLAGTRNRFKWRIQRPRRQRSGPSDQPRDTLNFDQHEFVSLNTGQQRATNPSEPVIRKENKLYPDRRTGMQSVEFGYTSGVQSESKQDAPYQTEPKQGVFYLNDLKKETLQSEDALHSDALKLDEIDLDVPEQIVLQANLNKVHQV